MTPSNTITYSAAFISALLIFIACFAQAKQNTAQNIYYEPTIKNIISNDCGRCHSGPTRNLMEYDTLKAYADGGMLSAMVQGPMRRFAGNDAQTIVDWVDQGAKEKPGARNVHFMTQHTPGNVQTQQAQTGGPGHQPLQAPQCPAPALHSNQSITYNNTIEQILKKDCLRCHSGRFRNLTTYKNVKQYADNGLLKTLVRLGGPMHRFAGPDAHTIIIWINNGAPQ